MGDLHLRPQREARVARAHPCVDAAEDAKEHRPRSLPGAASWWRSWAPGPRAGRPRCAALPHTSARPTWSAGSRSAPRLSRRRLVASMVASRDPSRAARRQSSRSICAAAAASARISGSSRSKPPGEGEAARGEDELAAVALLDRPGRRRAWPPACRRGSGPAIRAAAAAGRPAPPRSRARGRRAAGSDARVAPVHAVVGSQPPAHRRERPAHALRGQVAERAAEVDEARGPPGRMEPEGGPRRRLGQIDNGSHVKRNDRASRKLAENDWFRDLTTYGADPKYALKNGPFVLYGYTVGTGSPADPDTHGGSPDSRPARSQASSLRPMVARLPRARSRRRQVDAAHHPRPRVRPPPLRRAAAHAARHLDGAAALPPEPHGRRRPAHPPAVSRGPAARRLRADGALARARARHRRARAVGLRLDLERAAHRRGDPDRRDPAHGSRPAHPARVAARRGRGQRRRRPRQRPHLRAGRRRRRGRRSPRRRSSPPTRRSRGDVAAWVAALGPDGDTSGLTFAGDRGLAEGLLDGFVSAAVARVAA